MSRRSWIGSLFGLSQQSLGNKPQRSKQRRTTRLRLERYEDRIVPTVTVAFQQGVDGYEATTQVRIDSNNPTQSLDGSTVANGFYFLDGNGTGDTASPNQWDLIRFDKLFTSQGGPIPDGALIREAVLKYRTGSAAESNNSQTNGSFAVGELLFPFQLGDSWGSLGLQPFGPEAQRAGLVMGVHVATPVGAFGPDTKTGSYVLAQNTLAQLDVTSIVQNWSSNPSSMYGFHVRSQNTTDGWGVRTINHPVLSDRPLLQITYDPPPSTPLKTAVFQPGVNGYDSVVSVRIDSDNTTVDASTLTTPTAVNALIGKTSATTGVDKQLLIRFNDLFGDGPGQIPFGSTIDSAYFITHTPGLADVSNANSKGTWVASQVLSDWNLSTKYSDAQWGGNGPTFPGSHTASAPAIGATTAGELKVLSLNRAFTWDTQNIFDVTVAAKAWLANPASNFGLNLQAGGINNDNWSIHYTGSDAASLRPKLVINYSPPSPTGTNSADVADGTLTFVGGAGQSNNVSITVSAGVYTLTDSSGPISLSTAAKDAGWSGHGTSTITGPAFKLRINTRDGDDSITVTGATKGFVIDAGGQAGDLVTINGNVVTGNQNIAIMGAGTIAATASGLLNVGTGTVSFSNVGKIGTSTLPVATRASRINIAAQGDVFLQEEDGADLVGEVLGSGTLTVTNQSGTLRIPLNETLRTAGGKLSLTSNDGIQVDGILGVSGKGLLALHANADGLGTEGYVQGTRGNLAALGDVQIKVNTSTGGTGNATLGLSSIAGTYGVHAHGGSILWSDTLPNAGEGTAYVTASTVAVNYDFSATGPSSSIGTSIRPIPNWTMAAADAAGASKFSLQAGGGGVFFLARGPLDATIVKASATGAGPVRLVAGDAGGHNLIIDGPITAETGTITLQADDDLRLLSNALVGGPGFSGTVVGIANVDAGNEQRITMSPGASIVTSNTSSSAVNLSVTATDNDPTTSAIGGITLADVKVGSGGTITVAAGSSGSFTGNILQQPGTLLDAGSGKVVLTARALLQADNVTPAVGAGIGTLTNPIRVKAANVVATGTNSPVHVTGLGNTNFTGQAIGRTVPGNVSTPVPGASLNLTVEDGLLVIAGASTSQDGPMVLTSTGAGGGILVNAALGGPASGDLTLDAGSNEITCNANLTVNPGRTATLIAGKPANLPFITTNNGTIVASAGIQVGSGETLTGSGSVTGPVFIQANGSFTPGGSLTSIVNTGSLSLSTGGILGVNINGTTPGTGHDQIIVNGNVAIGGALLRISVGAVSLGDTVTLINNQGTNPVSGQFDGGTTVRAFNNPLVTFTLNYAGGDGNDVVATVSEIRTDAALLDVQGNQVLYFSNVGINNQVTVGKSGGLYTIQEGSPGAKISLTDGAKAAGWTGDGTNLVSGPQAGVAGLNFGLSDGNDTMLGIDAGAAGLSFVGSGTLTFAAPASTTGSLAFDEFTAITVNSNLSVGTGISFVGLNDLTLSGSGTLSTASGSVTTTRFGNTAVSGLTVSAPAGAITINGSVGTTTTLGTLKAVASTLTVQNATLTKVQGVVSASGTLSVGGETIVSDAGGRLDGATVLLNAGQIGGPGQPINTKAGAIFANGTLGVFVSELDGATFTGTTAGGSTMEVKNLAGTLVLDGSIVAGTGPLTLTSADEIVLAATGTITSAGKITLHANDDGVGSQGFVHAVGAKIVTTKQSDDAFSLTVNTPLGGKGDAVLGVTVVGANAGGRATVEAHQGSILWNPGYGKVSDNTLSNPVGGSSLLNTSFRAKDYFFSTASNGGSIGTLDTPLQLGNFASADSAAGKSNSSFAAGTGGIYVTYWSGLDPTVTSATATAGDIQIFTGNEGGHNLFVTGTVLTGNGNIWLAADDDLRIEGATIGGSSFAGEIFLQANRDNGNEQRIIMSGTTLVETTNTGPNAVRFQVFATDNDPSNATIGGITLGTVKSGSGGTIVLDAAAGPTFQGQIRQILGTRVDAGEGTVVLAARNKLNGGSPAVGASINYDLDGTGANTGPLQVRAKTVIVSATNTFVELAEGDGFFFADANGYSLTGVVSGLGFLKASTAAGKITVAGPTNTDGGQIALTAAGSSGGIIVDAALADADTGNLLLNAGSHGVTFNSSFTVPAGKTALITAGSPAQMNGPSTVLLPNSTIDAANGLALAAGSTLTGEGTILGSVLAGTGSVIDPGLAAPGKLTINELSLSGQLSVNLVNTLSFDRISTPGPVNLTGAKLEISVFGTLAVGDSFRIIDNTGSSAVVGTFTGGPEFTPINDPRYVFSVSTTGGTGNDVVLTVTKVLGTVLNVTPAGVVQYASAPGVSNKLSVDLLSGNYVVTDSSTPITLTQAAKDAGWTGSGTNTVTGPSAGVTELSLNTSNFGDTITKLGSGVPVNVLGLGSLSFTGAASVAGSLSVFGPGTVVIANHVAATGPVTISGVKNILNGSSGKISSDSITLTAEFGIGESIEPIVTQSKTLILSAGEEGVFITELDGTNVQATATAAGAIRINNLSGTLTVNGPIYTPAGAIELTSNDGLTLNAVIGDPQNFSNTGTITIRANADGVGTQGYIQTVNGGFVTANATANSVAITVNKAEGGTGNAVLGTGSAGGPSGGTISVNVFGGSAFWNSDYVLPPGAPRSGSNSNVLFARDFIFSATGVDSAIGTETLPIQIDAYGVVDGQAGENSLTILGSGGGAYFWEWGTMDLTLASAEVSGNGTLSVITANATGNNLFVTGNVKAASGNIILAADDNFLLGPGVVVGGPGFSGTVYLAGNLDKVTAGQPFTMDPTSSVTTSNTSPQAVLIELYGDPGTPSTITLANITVGNGGTIRVDGSPEGEAGRILVHPGTVLNAGPSGTVLLNAGLTTGSGETIGTSDEPVSLIAGTVGYSTLKGNVWIDAPAGAKFAGSNASFVGTARLRTQTGPLTVSGPLSGGVVNLNGPSVVVTGLLGGTGTKAITLNGPLSGTGSIVLDLGELTVSQNTDSFFAGTISGTPATIKQGTGTLTFTGAIASDLSVVQGQAVVNSTVGGSANVSKTAVLAGTGSVNGGAFIAGTLRPGVAGAGTIATGTLILTSDAALEIDLLGVNVSDADRVNVTGTVNLGNAALSLNVPNAIPIGTKFTLIANDGTDAVVGTFAGLPQGGQITSGGQTFTIDYAGGDGNDVVLTRSTPAVPSVTGIVINNGDAQRSRVLTIQVNFSGPVDAAQFQTAGAVTLTRLASSQVGLPIGFVVDTAAGLQVSPASGTVNSITLSFANLQNGGIDFGSLADGRWQLAIPAAGYLSSDATTPIRRLFGDSDATGIVDATDFSSFGTLFGGSLAPGNAFDFNNDNTLDSIDFAEFGNRFGRSL